MREVVYEFTHKEGPIGEHKCPFPLRPPLGEVPHETGPVCFVHLSPSVRSDSVLNQSAITPSNSPSYTSGPYFLKTLFSPSISFWKNPALDQSYSLGRLSF